MIALFAFFRILVIGWYFIPVERGEPVWLEPYENPNNDIYMISYVKPLYIGETLVGVLGIDLDYDTICDKVGGISLYESGYAILMDDSGKILYSGDHNPDRDCGEHNGCARAHRHDQPDHERCPY